MGMGILQNGSSRIIKSKNKTGPVQETPDILQSCVALGTKVLFECKVRDSLKVSEGYQQL